MKRLLHITIFTLLLNYSYAQQNLVPNGSFEEYTSCPDAPNQLHYAEPWFDPTKASSDYFNSCSLIPLSVGVPNNEWGNQVPFQGNAYSGFGAFSYDNTKNYREYLSVKLTEILVKDHNYCLSFYVNLADSSTFAIETIGATLSKDTLKVIPPNPINKLPNIVSTKLISDKLNWKKISGEYRAEGGEVYLTIGNFYDDNSCGLRQLKDTNSLTYSKGAYYYIDSVSFIKCSSDYPQIIIPNVFTPNNDGVNDIFKFNLNSKILNTTIYNRWGNVIFKTENRNHYWDGHTTSGEECADGTYYYIITTNTDIYRGYIQLIK